MGAIGRMVERAASGFRALFDSLIVPAYHKAFDLVISLVAKELWLIGGRASIKSTVAAYLIVLLVMMHKGMSAVVFRKHSVDIRTSVYPNIRQCIEWLAEKFPRQRLLERWKFREDCRFMTFDGCRGIVFHGLDDPQKRKSEKPPWGGWFGAMWCEETDEFGRDEIRSVKKSVLRGGPIGICIFTFNPPRSKRNWVNTEAARPKPGRYVFKTTFLDVLPYHPEWLGPTFIDEAMQAKAEDGEEWNWELMGNAIGTGTEIFPKCEQGEISDEMIAGFKRDGLARYGLDFGFTSHPTVLTESAYVESENTLYVWYGKYLKRAFEEDIKDEIESRGLMDAEIVADSAEDRAIAKLRQMGVRKIRGCWKSPDGWRDVGIRFIAKCRIVIDARIGRAKDVWEEMSVYAFATYKNGDLKEGYPKLGDDGMDSVRYGEEDVIKAHYKPKVWTLPQGYKRKVETVF